MVVTGHNSLAADNRLFLYCVKVRSNSEQKGTIRCDRPSFQVKSSATGSSSSSWLRSVRQVRSSPVGETPDGTRPRDG